MPILAPALPPPPPPPDPSTVPPWSNTVHWLGTVLTASQRQTILGRLRSQGEIPADQKGWM